MELCIGPVLFEWKRDELLRFYEEASGWPVDRVYIGEVVCSKKAGLAPGDIDSVRKMLESSGKKVTLSSLAVVSNGDELDFTRKLVSLSDSIEANDMSVLNMADPAVKEVFAGPHITAYNAPSIEFLKGVGISRVTFPVELPRRSIAHDIKNTGIFAEVFAHGRVPLAFSWRCYTSRAFGLGKTDCRHHCGKYPDGMEIKTMEREPLFTVNGTSVLSAKTYTLVEFVEDLKGIGVRAIRVSPRSRGTGKIIDVFRRRIDGSLSPEEGLRELKENGGEEFCNGWYLGGAGKDYTGLDSPAASELRRCTA